MRGRGDAPILRRLFQDVPGTQRRRLLLDGVARYSVTDQRTADAISRRLLRWVPASALVTNATACVGGNTLSLARHFSRVLAIERDPTRFRYLVHNLKVMGVQNVDLVNADPLVEMTRPGRPRCDLVFLDPPWGGPEYKHKKAFMLSLSGIPLWTVCAMLAPRARFIAVKVPVNFDMTTFMHHLPASLTLQDYDRGLRHMHIIILKSAVMS